MEDGVSRPAAGDRSVWVKAGALVGAIAVAMVVLAVVVGRRDPQVEPATLIEEMSEQYDVDLTTADAECMIAAGYGNAADLSALACLQGEQRRYFADVLWRGLAPVPASQAAVECFTAWAMDGEVSAQLTSIGGSAASVDDARQQALDYVLSVGVRGCAGL